MSQRTGLLLDVPKDSPSKAERVKAFKAKHEIDTHCCDKSDWMAVLMPAARRIGSAYGVKKTDGMAEIGAKVGRLVDEAGHSGYGRSEAEAIRALCEQNNLPCDL
jgi:hypothetical protein